MTPEPGTEVRMVMSKWGERAHWELDAIYLGSDEHGQWIGAPAGTLNARPGARFVSEVDSVSLVPPQDGRLVTHIATFHRPGIWCRVYVDIATPAWWDGTRLRAVDLDLDVIRGDSGRVWVDDEDEFADHRVRLGYPEEIAAAALASCARVHQAMVAEASPYDGAAEAWLTRLGSLRAT